MTQSHEEVIVRCHSCGLRVPCPGPAGNGSVTMSAGPACESQCGGLVGQSAATGRCVVINQQPNHLPISDVRRSHPPVPWEPCRRVSEPRSQPSITR